jgi:hypothetical protein
MLRKCIASLVLIGVMTWGARAEDIQSYVQAMPNVITEVDTAGSWSDEGKSGVFRAIVLIVPAGSTTEAHVVMQLLATNAEGTSWTVYKSVPVQQIADKKLPAATLAIEDNDTENEISWTVTAYDPKTGGDVNSSVKINAKGVVEVKDLPNEQPATAPEEKKP